MTKEPKLFVIPLVHLKNPCVAIPDDPVTTNYQQTKFMFVKPCSEWAEQMLHMQDLLVDSPYI